jgi:hypothetical protein
VLAGGGDYLDDEERARLYASIERGVGDVKAGRPWTPPRGTRPLQRPMVTTRP